MTTIYLVCEESVSHDPDAVLSAWESRDVAEFEADHQRRTRADRRGDIVVKEIVMGSQPPNGWLSWT